MPACCQHRACRRQRNMPRKQFGHRGRPRQNALNSCRNSTRLRGSMPSTSFSTPLRQRTDAREDPLARDARLSRASAAGGTPAHVRRKATPGSRAGTPFSHQPSSVFRIGVPVTGHRKQTEHRDGSDTVPPVMDCCGLVACKRLRMTGATPRQTRASRRRHGYGDRAAKAMEHHASPAPALARRSGRSAPGLATPVSHRTADAGPAEILPHVQERRPQPAVHMHWPNVARRRPINPW